MKINKIDDGHATITLDSTELVDICNSLHRDAKRLDRTDMLYANLMMTRDLSQYGNIDAFCLERILKLRGCCNE